MHATDQGMNEKFVEELHGFQSDILSGYITKLRKRPDFLAIAEMRET